MKNSTRFQNQSSKGWLSGLLLTLLWLAHPVAAQQASRFVSPTGPVDPSSVCEPVYRQNAGANYVATNHLTGSFGAADIGTTGIITTIDVGTYGGTLVFNGVYHVRGDVRFVNGTVELQSGTVFYVEGLSGHSIPTTSFPASTVIEVENASLELTGAVILSTCPQVWGGINLRDYGRIRTRADAAAIAPAGRSSIRDAYTAVNVVSPTTQYNSTGEYYLNNTDFINNYIGLNDPFKSVARAGEGAHYCTFQTDASLKTPLTNFAAYWSTGIKLSIADQAIGVNNYAAASIDHCTFHHLDYGIDGTAQQLRISDNSFDYVWQSAIILESNSGGQGVFRNTPMYVERNDIMIRGTNPRGYPTTWGIRGGVYANGNYIHGDDANPAGNSVEQVGMLMYSADNSTQTNNTFERLDKGIEAGVDNWYNGQRDISGNLFRNVVQGISFFTYIGAAMDANQLYVRCNSFENPGNLAGAVALTIEGPNFPTQLGNSSSGNGNRFVTPGLPFIEPIDNSLSASFFIYFSFFSTQEDLTGAAQNGTTYLVAYTGGNPATACTGAGYSNGINNRTAAAKPGIGVAELQNAYDSLRLTNSFSRRNTLLNTVIAAATQQENFADLETYVASLPGTANPVHALLGSWLLRTYRAYHREADAQRIRTALLARHAHDAEISSFVQLSDVLVQLGQAAGSPAPAAIAALQQVAASGTAAARVACPLARRYAPVCPCRFPAKASAQVLGKPDLSDAATAGLGIPYPNPANETVRIPYTLQPGHGSAHLEVRNLLGQLVQQIPLLTLTGEVQIEVSKLAAGLYSCALVGAGHPFEARRIAVTK